MLAITLAILVLSGTVFSEITIGGIERTMSPGVKSMGYKIIYGEDDIAEVNEVVKKKEKLDMLKSKVNINEAVPPLQPQDVKCLMSTDNHCTKNMYEIKGILIEALKNDCEKCSLIEKEKAGKIVASMLAHDPVAWKIFLTRYAMFTKLNAKTDNDTKQKTFRYKVKGEPEELHESKNRIISPGASVRVRRYTLERV
ncbi:hypothetical protein RR46_02270 [Papilio xuthus]|uniref:Chemosensory protein n=1 Tax=Papilio xuthus TaxID=66420 RepID=A0A194QJK0_PAPXU|nr:hypothetical protein RR46_02270 [Papilio xuthus]